jgi:sugar transferase (PEP-CTERM system associated)
MLQLSSRRAKHVFFITLDIVAVFISLHLSYVFYGAIGWQTLTPDEFFYGAIAVSSLIALSHMAVGLYEPKIRESVRSVFRRGILSAGLVFFAYHIGAGLLAHNPHNLTLISGLVLAVIFQSAWRYWLINKGALFAMRRKVLFVGAGDRARFITERMRRDVDRIAFSGWDFLALERTDPLVKENECVHPPKSEEALSKWLNSLCPDVVVLANDRGESINVNLLLDLKMSGAEVVELEDFVEAELCQIAVERMRPEWLLVSKGFNFNRLVFDKLNYVFNATLALVVFLLTSPLMLFAAIAIYFDDGRRDKASCFYKQVRVGEGHRPFEIIKFRSMGVNAEKNGAQWAVENDMRVTRVGHYLRKYRIDELPQLLNVLRGEMCFVGPRPERPVFVDKLAENIPFFNYRHCVKPGLTGWAQVNYPYGSTENDSFEKLKFDLYYIKHRSFLLDLFVLLRTVEIVLFGRGR